MSLRGLKFASCVLGYLLFLVSCTSVNQPKKEMSDLVNDRLAKATEQAEAMAFSLKDSVGRLPKTFEHGKLETSDSHWWCSGFFPGVLWYLYENNPDETLKKLAIEYSERVKKEQFTTDNHDIGFIIFCSYGNAYRLLGESSYKDAILQAAHSLSTRFVEKTGLIRSWNSEEGQIVIIDNMMNLEMLMWAALNSDNPELKKMAMSHADRTMKEHFREDYSSYHLLYYDTETGKCLDKKTVQGYADESAWARGQAWGLYGYTMMYRMTKEERYLEQAENIAHFILSHPNLPKDMIPYWDFNAPNIPNEERDASAAAVMASAFIELSQYISDKDFSEKTLLAAEEIIKTLSSSEYFAEKGTNGNFILKHSVGFKGVNSEVDVPLTYADYYYIEALMRYKKMFMN
ncbi:glycoside hydrolase family 88 protein [Bacteroides sp.]|uniref:glycoside hydrolase family 88 protein n=1 Tax=Bacteroides sp. TaxID=29523 RepID=UPI0025884147|nr:glycoside hydrolase family 88 protein [Bacteroides sp.]